MGAIGTIAFSLAKETDARIRFQSALTAIAGSPYLGRVSYDRTGGLTSWRAGWGRCFGAWINAGIAYERLNFMIVSTKLIELENDMANNTRDSTTVRFTANALHVGIMVPVDKLVIGLSGRYVFRDDLKYSRGQYRTGEASPINETDSAATAGVRIPPQAGLGVSYSLSPRWLAAADVRLVQWERYSAHGFLPKVDAHYSVSAGAGIRFIAAPEILEPRYWETIHCRAGIQYAQSPTDDGSEFSLSLGAGFPLKPSGLVDVVVRAGRRSGNNFPDYTEDFIQILFGINGGRKWIKTAGDTY
jgi:hypothetical protein